MFAIVLVSGALVNVSTFLDRVRVVRVVLEALALVAVARVTSTQVCADFVFLQDSN